MEFHEIAEIVDNAYGDWERVEVFVSGKVSGEYEIRPVQQVSLHWNIDGQRVLLVHTTKIDLSIPKDEVEKYESPPRVNDEYQCPVCMDTFSSDHFNGNNGPCNDCRPLNAGSKAKTHARMHDRAEWCRFCQAGEVIMELEAHVETKHDNR